MAEGRSTPAALIVAMRPRQWLKNVLVFAAPLAAGELFKPAVLVPSLVAFVAFCLMSSATYLVNDLRDVEADRDHPVKRTRPIAAGQLSSTPALVAAVVLAIVALAMSLRVDVGLMCVVAAYATFTLSYSLYFKREPVIELVLIAMGFLLRAIAGGIASNLPISQWFLIVAGFGSLFMAAGKRYSELTRVLNTPDEERATHVRRSLQGYTPGFLRLVIAIAAAVTITGYCLWAFEVGANPTSVPWETWSVVPFVVGILRYGVDVERGEAEAPEDVVLHDPVLLATGGVWLVLFGLGAMGV